MVPDILPGITALSLMLLATPPLATPMLIVPDILPGISCFISIVYHNLKSSRTSTSTVSSTSPSSSSSSQEFSPKPDPARSTSFPSTYASAPSTEEYPVALPMLILVGCIIGTCACGIALAAHNMWRSKTKQKLRRNDQQRENQHSSAQDVVD